MFNSTSGYMHYSVNKCLTLEEIEKQVVGYLDQRLGLQILQLWSLNRRLGLQTLLRTLNRERTKLGPSYKLGPSQNSRVANSRSGRSLGLVALPTLPRQHQLS
jgi:hypothetical protein